MQLAQTGSVNDACSQLMVAAYALMDHGRYEECAALFAEDATWVRGGKPVEGRAAILDALNARRADSVSRHLIASVLIFDEGPGKASGTASFVPVRGMPDGEGNVPISGPAMAGDLTARFGLIDGRWAITYLAAKVIFRGEG